jgi:hypothetical protein
MKSLAERPIANAQDSAKFYGSDLSNETPAPSLPDLGDKGTRRLPLAAGGLASGIMAMCNNNSRGGGHYRRR